MEIDEHLKYTLYGFYELNLVCFHVLTLRCSLQFDPCPRAGEPMVSRSTLPILHTFFFIAVYANSTFQGRPTTSSNRCALCHAMAGNKVTADHSQLLLDRVYRFGEGVLCTTPVMKRGCGVGRIDTETVCMRLLVRLTRRWTACGRAAHTLRHHRNIKHTAMRGVNKRKQKYTYTRSLIHITNRTLVQTKDERGII